MRVTRAMSLFRRGDPDFFDAYASGIWLYVIQTLGPNLVQAGFLEENVRLRAEEDYGVYVQRCAPAAKTFDVDSGGTGSVKAGQANLHSAEVGTCLVAYWRLDPVRQRPESPDGSTDRRRKLSFVAALTGIPVERLWEHTDHVFRRSSARDAGPDDSANAGVGAGARAHHRARD